MSGLHAEGPPPRVLLVTGAYFPEISAGGLQCQAVARLLGPRVTCQVLTTATDPALADHDVVEGVPVSRIGVDAKRGAGARATPRMLRELLRLVPRVDLVHVQGFSYKNILVSAVARWFKRPLVMSLQTARHDEPHAVAEQGRLAWWAFTSADLYLGVSPGLVEPYLAAGLPRERIREVPNGVDLVRFSPATAVERIGLRRRLGLPLEKPLVLFVGTFARDKQPHVLFDAWALLQRDLSLASTLVFVGATSPRQFEADAGLAAEIRRNADRLGLGHRVVFVEPTSQVQDYFRASDAFVLPSSREGLPIALLEAMACGLPCVASRLPGATDAMITHGVDGLLVPPGDSGAFSVALASVLASPADAARLGAAARRTAEQRYGMARVAEDWLAAYRHVMTTA